MLAPSVWPSLILSASRQEVCVLLLRSSLCSLSFWCLFSSHTPSLDHPPRVLNCGLEATDTQVAKNRLFHHLLQTVGGGFVVSTCFFTLKLSVFHQPENVGLLKQKEETHRVGSYSLPSCYLLQVGK